MMPPVNFMDAMENVMATRLLNHWRRAAHLTKTNKIIMNDLRRQINTIIFDPRLFLETEIAKFQARMFGATNDQLEAILKEAQELEQARWKEYQSNKYQAA